MTIEATLQSLTDAINDLNRNLAVMNNQQPAHEFKEAEQPAPTPQPEQEAPKTAEQPAPVPQFTKDQLAAGLKGIAQTHGRDAAITILKQFNATRVSDIDPSQWQFLAEAIITAGGTLNG